MISYSSILTVSGDPDAVGAIGKALERAIEGQLRPVKRVVDGQVHSALSLWSSNELRSSTPDDAEAELISLLVRAKAALEKTDLGASPLLIAQVVMRVAGGECRGFYFGPKTVLAASSIGAALEIEVNCTD
jgi:alkylated DNA nucleotide flippase Atl1